MSPYKKRPYTNYATAILNRTPEQKDIIAQSIARAREALRKLRALSALPPVGPRELLETWQRERK